MENTRHCWNKTVCVGCTERTLVLSIFHYSFFLYVSLFFCLFMLYSASVSSLHIVSSGSLYESTAKWETCQVFKEDVLLVCIQLEHL